MICESPVGLSLTGFESMVNIWRMPKRMKVISSAVRYPVITYDESCRMNPWPMMPALTITNCVKNAYTTSHN
jgi:hypothetical protein